MSVGEVIRSIFCGGADVSFSQCVSFFHSPDIAILP